MSRRSRKKGTGSLMQIFPIIIVLALIGTIFGPKKKEESTTRNNWSTSQTQTVPNNHTESQYISNDNTGSQNTYNTRPDPEELQEQADSFLSENFQLDVVELQDRTLRYEITVTSAGISDREDQSEAPENWDNFQLDFISAQARTSDELGISSKNTLLILVDSSDEVMLSTRNGIIIENRYKEDVKPVTPNTQQSGTQQSGDRTVWVTKTGKRYHYSSTCNGGTYYSSTLSAALGRGLTPCDKCVN